MALATTYIGHNPTPTPTPTPRMRLYYWRQLRPITANYVIGATVLAQGLGDRLSFPLLIDRYSSELLQVMYR